MTDNDSKTDARLTLAFEVVDSLMRSWWTVVMGVGLGVAAALVSLQFMPKVFEASTTIFVGSGTLPDGLVPSTVSDDMRTRMAALRKAVLSRPYLEKIAGEHYMPLPTSDAERDALLFSIRGRVIVDVARGYFSIRYRDGDAGRAAAVANELANLYIDENAQFRADRAGEATDTLAELAQGVLEELQAKEQAILAYKSQHPFETEANRETNMRMRELLQRDVETLDTSLQFEEDGLSVLQSQLGRASAPDATSAVEDITDDPYTATLSRLQRELNDLKSNYLDTHPAVRAKIREIEDFQRTMGGGAAAVDGGAPAVSPAIAKLQMQIDEKNLKIERMRQKRARTMGEIRTYDRRLEATPLVEARLAELANGLDILRSRYRDYQSKAESAKGAQKLEEGRKGAQFEIIERARAASLPVSPNATMVFGSHIIISLLIFVGPLVLKRLLNPVILSQAALRSFSDAPVLVAIPALPTPDVEQQRRKRKMTNFGLTFATLVVLAGVIIFRTF